MMDYPPTAEGLLDILRKLRSPGGCPWDREQTRQSLSRCLAEECAELLDAIDRNDPVDICDELGDLFMNVLFQCVVAEERGEFDYSGMASGIIDKMIRRHAHIFGDARADTPEEVTALWVKIKEREKGKTAESLMDGAGQYLTALNRAEKLQKKAAKVGFDWTEQCGIIAKIEEELAELKEALAEGDEVHVDEELGDLFFALTNLARFRKRAASEELLRAANRKFEERFRRMEATGEVREGLSPEQWEELWSEAKKEKNSRC